MAATWTALSGSVRGETHETLGKENQDAVRVYEAPDELFLAVADGHGSPRSFRSARGAVMATECAIRVLRDFIWRNGRDASFSSLRRQLQKRVPQLIVAEWHRAVRADVLRDPFAPIDFAAFPENAPVIRRGEELPFSAYLAYGSTLVVAAVTRRFIAYLQLGDGDILQVWKNGSVSRPWPSGHAFYNTHTLSLCSSDAAVDFKVRVEPRRREAPAMILLATDGYANCFCDDAGFFTVGSDLLAYLRMGGVGMVQEKLDRWLGESSRDGSRDDITVAMGIRLATLHSPHPPETDESA